MCFDVDMNPMQGSGPGRAWLRTASAFAMGVGLGDQQVAAHAVTLGVGHPAPPLVLHTLDGCSIVTDDLCGQIVILTFWATWCSPCHTESPLPSVYAICHADKGLRVLGFGLDEPVELSAVREIAARPSFPVGLLDNVYTDGRGRIRRLSVNFTVDHKGLLADNGWDSRKPAWMAEHLERVVTPLLC